MIQQICQWLANEQAQATYLELIQGIQVHNFLTCIDRNIKSKELINIEVTHFLFLFPLSINSPVNLVIY